MSESTENHGDPADAGSIVPNRVGVYGSVTETYPRIAAMMSAVLDHEVQPWQVPLLVICLKMVRISETPDYSDNSDDIEGYLAVFRELIGDDMVHARSVTEYLEKKAARDTYVPRAGGISKQELEDLEAEDREDRKYGPR